MTKSPPPITIRRIAPSGTAAVRHAVLWPSIPIDAQLLPFDHLASTIHLGAYDPGSGDAHAAEGEPVGVLTITLENYARALPESIRISLSTSSSGSTGAKTASLGQYQLHKFAVLPSYQGRGIGRALLSCATDELDAIMMQDHLDAILFHFDARALQRGLYEHMGYAVLDREPFIKYGSTGKGPGVEYIKMGRVIRRDERHA